MREFPGVPSGRSKNAIKRLEDRCASSHDNGLGNPQDPPPDVHHFSQQSPKTTSNACPRSPQDFARFPKDSSRQSPKPVARNFPHLLNTLDDFPTEFSRQPPHNAPQNLLNIPQGLCTTSRGNRPTMVPGIGQHRPRTSRDSSRESLKIAPKI